MQPWCTSPAPVRSRRWALAAEVSALGRRRGFGECCGELIYCICRKPGLSREEFIRHWADVHGPIGARIPGLRKLLQSCRLRRPSCGSITCLRSLTRGSRPSGQLPRPMRPTLLTLRGAPISSARNARFSNQPARTARLEVFQDNTRAQPIHQPLGFRETGHRIVHDRDGRIEVRIERPVNQAKAFRGVRASVVQRGASLSQSGVPQ